jgi:hypothetical protein
MNNDFNYGKIRQEEFVDDAMMVLQQHSLQVERRMAMRCHENEELNKMLF